MSLPPRSIPFLLFFTTQSSLLTLPGARHPSLSPGLEPPGVLGHEGTQSRRVEDFHLHWDPHARPHALAPGPPHPAHPPRPRRTPGPWAASVRGPVQRLAGARASPRPARHHELSQSAPCESVSPGPACAWVHTGADTRGYARTGQALPRRRHRALGKSTVAVAFGTIVTKRPEAVGMSVPTTVLGQGNGHKGGPPVSHSWWVALEVTPR